MGKEQRIRKVAVKIPAGVDEGTTMRLSGEGDSGFKGGAPGNLYVTLSVEEHEFFKRDGADIIYDLPLNFTQAALGGEIDVPTVEGALTLKIPAGIQSGKILRLKGMGVAHLRKASRGDQVVIVHVVTPTSLDGEQKKLLLELAKTLGPATLPRDGKGFFGKMKDAFASRD